MRVQVPVYPPSSPFRFHLQLKRLLVPPCGAFSRRCLRPRCGCCLSSSFFSFFLSSLSHPPYLTLCFSFVQPLFCPSARARAQPRLFSSCPRDSPSCCARSDVVGVRETVDYAAESRSYAWGRHECGWKSTAGHQPPLSRHSAIRVHLYRARWSTHGPRTIEAVCLLPSAWKCRATIRATTPRPYLDISFGIRKIAWRR